jgi:hypothetical protein
LTSSGVRLRSETTARQAGSLILVVRQIMEAAKQSMPNAVYAILAYPLLVLLMLIVAALIWAYWVSGRLYNCTDPGFGIFDIIPPFVHVGTDDVYLASPWKLWAVWSVLIATAFIVPLGVIIYIWRREEDSNG